MSTEKGKVQSGPIVMEQDIRIQHVKNARFIEQIVHGNIMEIQRNILQNSEHF